VSYRRLVFSMMVSIIAMYECSAMEQIELQNQITVINDGMLTKINAVIVRDKLVKGSALFGCLADKHPSRRVEETMFMTKTILRAYP